MADYSICLLLVIDCGSADQLSGSLPLSLTSTLFEDTFTFECRATYELVGESTHGSNTVMCNKHGIWDFGTLECIREYISHFHSFIEQNIKNCNNCALQNIKKITCDIFIFNYLFTLESSDVFVSLCKWQPLIDILQILCVHRTYG